MTAIVVKIKMKISDTLRLRSKEKKFKTVFPKPRSQDVISKCRTISANTIYIIEDLRMMTMFSQSIENNNKHKSLFVVISLLWINSLLIILFGLSNAYGIEIYSKNDTPFGLPLEAWLGKFWIWWAAVPNDDNAPDKSPPKENGCLINSSDSMVMLMETTVDGKPHQVCNISSKQGIVVPLWVSFMEDSISEDGTQKFKGFSYDQLSKESRETLDLGAVTSEVKVDGINVAKLDVVSSMRAGVLDYKINSMNNVTELYSKGFNITIPENSHLADQNAGTWRSGAHGWLVFLKPLPPGEHTIFYNVGVDIAKKDPLNSHAAEITYTLHVK